MTQPPAMALLPTEVESDLRATVRDLLVDRCEAAAVTALYDGDRSLVAPLWKAMAEDLGLAGLLIAEGSGGAGASAREAGAVLEELGRAVAPVPFLTSAVIATTALLGTADGQAEELLRGLATGERTAALLVPVSAAPADPLPVLERDSAGRFAGRVTSVAGALEADTLLALVATDTGSSLAVLDGSSVTVDPVSSLDMSRQLADVTVDGSRASVVRTDGELAVRRALLAGAALLASEQAGIARWCLEETVSYLMVRKQFGRPVGGFQAIKHRLADLYAEVEAASAAAANAAAVLAAFDADRDPPIDRTELEIAVTVAQSHCSDVAVHAAEEAVQLHGGIGMTWEHPIHLYLKRAKSAQIALGTPGRHRTRLAELVDLPGAGG